MEVLEILDPPATYPKSFVFAKCCLGMGCKKMEVKYELHTYVVAGSVEQNTPDLATHLPQVQANRKVVITQINHFFSEQIAASRFVLLFLLPCVGIGQGWLVFVSCSMGIFKCVCRS